VRFEINLAAADQRTLTIGSQLLALAGGQTEMA
jgi:hypothetical protein